MNNSIKSNITPLQILELPKITDPRGNLSIIEQLKQIPFEIKRVYWIYDVPGGCDRGGHAYKENQEFIVALSGSFDVELDDGNEKLDCSLNRSYYGIYVPKGIWRKLTNFSTNSLALVLSSTEFDANDYILDYSEYIVWSKNNDIPTNSPNVEISKQICITPYIAKDDYKKNVFDCSLYELNAARFPEGSLTFIYENIHIPFPINRVFYSYDIPGGESRGGHAHKECHQFIIAASGAFEVLLDDGVNKRTVTLNRPFYGLHVPPGVWAAEQGFSSGSICLVLASHEYNENDYIRTYEDFINYKKQA